MKKLILIVLTAIVSATAMPGGAFAKDKGGDKKGAWHFHRHHHHRHHHHHYHHWHWHHWSSSGGNNGSTVVNKTTIINNTADTTAITGTTGVPTTTGPGVSK